MKCAQIAILCSDLHLTLKPPACRNDSSWMGVQAGYLKQLGDLAQGLPILCAGDIFDRWNPPPELIRFALKHLPPDLICVPGQHDLPNHEMGAMHRSAYGVLVEANKIRCASTHRREEVPARSCFYIGSHWRVYGFGWNEEITPPPSKEGHERCLALVHKYIWKVGHTHPGASEASHVGTVMKSLKHYDVAAFGDNHSGFYLPLKSGTKVLNCGVFIRRKADELDYKPRVGILYENGHVEIHHLNTKGDKFRTAKELAKAMEVDVSAFVEQLETMKEHGLDFRESVRRGLDQMALPGPVRELVLKCIE